MFPVRILLFGFATAAFAAGPITGKFDFTGKDSAGVAWRGVFTIGKLDESRFNPAKYTHMCSLDLKSASSSRGVDAPCKYDPATRKLSIGGGSLNSCSYTAVVSEDGRIVTQGKWEEYKDGIRRTGQQPVVIKTGEWSARRTEQ